MYFRVSKKLLIYGFVMPYYITHNKAIVVRCHVSREIRKMRQETEMNLETCMIDVVGLHAGGKV